MTNSSENRITITIKLPYGTVEIQGQPKFVEENIPRFLQTVRTLQNELVGLTPIEPSSPQSQTESRSPLNLTKVYEASLKGRIHQLLDEGVLDAPIPAEKISKELEKRGYYYESRRISYELTRSFIRRNLVRRLGSRGKYQYVKT